MVENRVLSIAGYLYGLNTLCLTFRVFGHVMEQSEGVGTIQAALFRILKDVGTIVWQFMAVILAFSIATTKVYVVETSFLASGSGRNDTLVYISIRAIVIYLDFCSTRRALRLVDSWSRGPDQIQMYPDRDTIPQLLHAPDVLLRLLQEKSKYITKHLMSGPSGN